MHLPSSHDSPLCRRVLQRNWTLALWRAVCASLALGPTAPLAGQQPSTVIDSSALLDGRGLPVREHLLDNGMRFLLLERAGAPTVSFVAHVPVGSVNETPGITGISHFLEHLMFKGTTTIGTNDVEAERALFEKMDAAHDSLVETTRARVPDQARIDLLERRLEALEDSARAYVVPNEYDQILGRNGARGPNATTSYEATQYFVSLPSNRAKLWFVMEADRMRSPVFREFFTERRVIAEERRTRTDTSPAGLLSVAYLAAAFREHPYGRAPIGYPEDILSISRQDVQAYYDRYYGPQNTTVAIVGRFEADSAIVWADRYFGSLEAGEPVPPVLTREPTQLEERRVEIRHEAEPQLRIGWKVPSDLDPVAPTLAVLANLLVGGSDARLYRRLVRDDRIASSVFAGTGPGSLHPGLFTIQATPRAPHTAEEVELAIYEELDRLRIEPPTEDELVRVRTGLEAAQVRRLTSAEGLAFQLANSQANWGDWRETFRLQERMREVRGEDVTESLNRFFHENRRTVAILRPSAGP